MDLDLVEKMMQLMRSYGMHAMEIKDGDVQVKLTQSPQPVAGFNSLPMGPLTYGHPPTVAVTPPPAGTGAERASHPTSGQSTHQGSENRAKLIEVRSPFVGTFYGAPSPGAENFVTVGKRIRKGDTLCIIEAMKLMNEIEAERDGVIVEVLARNEEPVEYDQVLFLME